MPEENKPPIVEQPPVRSAPPVQVRPQPPAPWGPKPTYPEVFVNARWRLAIIGGVGLLGILAATAILSVPRSPGDNSAIYVFLVFAGFFSILVIYALLHLGSKWTLHEDRLEYRSFFGARKTIRKLDVISFAPDWTGIRSVLRDAHSSIPVGWEINRFGYLRDVLRTWAPRQR